jgi:hypothetical protein
VRARIREVNLSFIFGFLFRFLRLFHGILFVIALVSALIQNNDKYQQGLSGFSYDKIQGMTNYRPIIPDLQYLAREFSITVDFYKKSLFQTILS